MAKPLACCVQYSISLWFIIGLLCSFYYDMVLFKSMALHIIPIFVMSQYIKYNTDIVEKCIKDFPFKVSTPLVMAVDFFSHWLPIIMYIWFLNSNYYRNIPMVYTGLIGVCCLQYIYYIYIERYLQENNLYGVDNYDGYIKYNILLICTVLVHHMLLVKH